jgi:3-hydroxyisobutyrate dehydrogenase-like beta-hydroxyacid dehydrogenase
MTKQPSHDDNRLPVTVLGLGPMGRALAEAFLTNRHPTTVWNRSAGKAADLVERGALRTDTAAEAVAASRLTIVCVLDDKALHAVLDPIGPGLSGRTLVNLTSGPPESARATAAWAAAHGADYLDGAILTPVATIGQPSAVVLYSGSKALYEAHHSTLASIGGTAVHLGSSVDRSAAYDMALLDIFWTTMSGIVHGFALAAKEGIPAKELMPFARGISTILPGIMDNLAHNIDAGHHPGTGSTIVSATAGMDHVIHTAQAHGIDVSVLNAARAVTRRAIDEGHGTNGFSHLADMLGKPAPAN